MGLGRVVLLRRHDPALIFYMMLVLFTSPRTYKAESCLHSDRVWLFWTSFWIAFFQVAAQEDTIFAPGVHFGRQIWAAVSDDFALDFAASFSPPHLLGRERRAGKSTVANEKKSGEASNSLNNESWGGLESKRQEEDGKRPIMNGLGLGLARKGMGRGGNKHIQGLDIGGGHGRVGCTVRCISPAAAAAMKDGKRRRKFNRYIYVCLTEGRRLN